MTSVLATSDTSMFNQVFCSWLEITAGWMCPPRLPLPCFAPLLDAWNSCCLAQAALGNLRCGLMWGRQPKLARLVGCGSCGPYSAAYCQQRTLPVPYYLHFCSVRSSLAQRTKGCWYGWVRTHSFVIKIGTFPAWTFALEIASSD